MNALFLKGCRPIATLVFLGTLMCVPGISLANDMRPPEVSAAKGAEVFSERCSLCHGSDGRGEGILSLSIANYPPTNLLVKKHAQSMASIREVVTYGGSKGLISTEMPPWADELSHGELESVVLFVAHLREDFQNARQLLAQADKRLASARMGRALYRTRCSLCHGHYGQGDGRLAAIIKQPPPFNLTLSRMSKDDLRAIISKGGQAVGRSERMPPWEGSLTRVEIDSLVLYLLELRETGPLTAQAPGSKTRKTNAMPE